ncbi:MAG TPA: hypothetical protein VG387_09230 [Rhizomicrobium sp.]|jgi:hypothetical protein|nr:hypothetical protein [Rhizomicrobium sp.]
MPSPLRFHLLFGLLRLRSHTVVPLQRAVLRRRVARSSGTKRIEHEADLAWALGDSDTAIPLWRKLEEAQPTRATWPMAISRATSERGDFAAAEQTLRDAQARGIRDDQLDIALQRYARMGRRSNAGIEEAEAIVADPRAPDGKVFYAAFFLLGHNRLGGARAGYERLRDTKEHGWQARGHLAAIARLEEWHAQGHPDVPGWLSPAESSVLVRAPSSDTLVIGFTLPLGTLSLPVNAVHTMLSSKGVNALYLYDSRQVFHLAGTDRFGPGYQALLDGIRALAAELGTRRLITVGSSATGLTALRVAMDLDADGALLFSGQTLMPANAEPGGARSAHTFARMRANILPMMKNLRDDVASHPRQHIELFYGAGERRDRMHAANLAGLPNVTLNPIAGLTRHDSLNEMVVRGYRDLLDRFARGN